MNRRNLSDLRGAARLAVDATVGVTDLVEKMHRTIQMGHAPVGDSRAGTTRGLTGLIYRTIRGTTRLVGKGIDAGITPITELLPAGTSNETRNLIVSAVNGVYGDHLVATGNPLALEMSLLYQGQPASSEQPGFVIDQSDSTVLTGKVMLFIHGLCLNETHWSSDGCNHGQELAAELGYTPLYLRYNTGLPIADNGRNLANLLESLLRGWPHPVSELAIVGHSMGGLLARSASHYGHVAGHDWLRHLHRLVSIGTPHHGAPLERGGNWLDYAMSLSPYVAPFMRISTKRSAGINDLAHGNITDIERDFVSLPSNVKCYAMAATLGKKQTRLAEALTGDGLVPLDSALGKHKDAGRTLMFPEHHQWIGFETGHLELLGSPDVYTQLRDWFE